MKPKLSLLFAIALVSASALAYEVLLMRLFSIIQWHHFAYMIISLALLGYGISGVFLALNRDRLSRAFTLAVMINMLLFSLSAPACFMLAQLIPFNPAEMLWTPVQLLYLCAIYLILVPPFFFAANIIGLCFYYYKDNVSSIYAADLFGAGGGSIGIILLLFWVFPEQIFTILMLLGIAAMLIVLNAFREQSVTLKQWISAPLIIAVAIVFTLTGWMTLNVSPYKSQNQLLRVPGTKIIARYSSPLGLISVVNSADTPLRHAPGLSLNASTEPPDQLAVFTDADNMTAITRYNGNPESISYLDQTTSALPYHLKSFPNILILGAGTGSDVLLANYHAIKHIDAVELNPQIIDLVNEKQADFAGHLYAGNHISLHLDEARGFVATDDKSYDLINISLLDAFGASAAGLYSMAENYLYTVQAIQDYLRHVSPGGYLSITRWVKLPPRDEAKLVATVITALKQLKIPHPARQLLMIRSWQTSTLLVKNGVITDDEINHLQQFCNDRSFDLVYYPGIQPEEVNRFNIQPQPYLYQVVTALLSNESKTFITNYKFNIEPSTDDKPYFFHFLKWKTLPEIVPLLNSGGIFLLETGYLLLIAALLQAILASLLLIALPLWLCKGKLGIEPESSNYRGILVYFLCLGLAFLFIEIAFIQKLILILHHPLYAITVVLSTFLLSAGAGSQYSRTWSGNPEKTIILLPIVTLSLLSIGYILSFEFITGFLLKAGDISRYVLSMGLIAPLGFCMGMPFPMALAKLGKTTPALIPWAWGINGCASVISTILATLIAMQFGFNVLIILALVLYGVAAWCFPE
jgi:hypothetical protein